MFQPYQQQNDFFLPYNNQPQQHRQQNKKKSENRQNVIKNQPVQQFDYIFGTTTPKPSRKTTKPNSSHNNKQSNTRHFNSDIVFNDSLEVTTKRNRVTPNNRRTTAKPTVKPSTRKTTTTARPTTRRTTERDYSSIIFIDRDTPYRPVTEKVRENNNQKEVYTVNNYQTQENTRRPNYNSGSNDYNNNYNNVPTNNRNPNVQNINLNTQPNRGTSGFNNEFIRPSNNRNPDVYAINNQNRPQNNKNTNFASTSGFINSNNNYNNNNRVVANNFGNNFNNNRGVLNTDYVDYNRGTVYPNYPTINRPGVKPIKVDPNQAPITNRPVTDRNNVVPFDRPSNGGYGYTEKPAEAPEVLIGPDEDSMSEQQKRRYIDVAEKSKYF